MNQELAVRKSQDLASFGGRDQLKELGERLRKLMPGSNRFTEDEALTVAQVALAHNLDPFNGEVWGLKGDNGKWYGVMVGIKGLRKKAREQAKEEGGNFWISYSRADPEYYNQPKTAIIYKATLRDSISFGTWSRSYIEIVNAAKDQPDDVKRELLKYLGEPPFIVGIGIANPEEKSKMDIHTRAKKRAEADALKQRYDISFTGAIVDYSQLEQNGEIVDGQYTSEDDLIEVEPEKIPAEKLTEDQLIEQLGF